MSREQLEGRNPIYECFAREKRRVFRVWIDRGARLDDRLNGILAAAKAKQVEVKYCARRELDERAHGRVHNGIIAEVEAMSSWTTKSFLDDLFARQEDPFIILMADCAYEHNLGAVMRSSLGFGAHAVILPTRKGASVSPVVQRVAMGAAEVVPVIREGMNSALKHIRKAGIPVVGAAMGGRPLRKCRLAGPLAILLGGEGAGLSDNLIKRCDYQVAIPLAGDLESLNVSVAAAVLMYEKRIQDGWYA
jgi:23S rRNA (guanosine2251-2'-O)-methyltransferase